MKRCSRCKVEKNTGDFHRRSSASDGLQNYCIECCGISKILRHAKDPGKRLAYENSASRKEAKAAWSQEVRRRRPSYQLDYGLRRKYGISLADYEQMLKAQGSTCAMCKQPETSEFNGKARRLSVDHCHVTGVVRGLLCTVCNVCARPDDVKHLQMRIAYLRRHMQPTGMESHMSLMISNLKEFACG